MRQEQIADLIYTHVSSMGEVSGIEDAADAILADLPNTIALLDWNGVEDECFVYSEALGHYYELVVFDTLDRPCDYVWRADVRYCNQNVVAIDTPAQASFEQAKAAANKHHRDAIMAEFK
jgi:hypothetical protein